MVILISVASSQYQMNLSNLTDLIVVVASVVVLSAGSEGQVFATSAIR